jgi:hypothetical protein
VRGPVDAVLGGGDDDRLERHAERVGRVRPVPLVGPRRPQHPGRLPGERPGPQRVGRGRGQHLLLHDGVRLGLLGGEPNRAAPHALGAERHGRGHLATPADAAGTEHGDRRDGVHHLGDEDHGPDLAGVAPGLGTLGDDDVDAGLHVPFGVDGLPGQGADQPALLLHPVDEELRRRPERVGHERRLVGEGDLELRTGRVGRERRGAARPPDAPAGLAVGRHLGHVVAAQDVVDELPGLGRDELDDVVERVAAARVAGVAGGDDEVDAVGPVADLVLDPAQVDLELLGRVGDGAEHAQPTGLRHRGDDVAAVGEGEDRQVDGEQVGDGGAHQGSSMAGSVGRAAFMARAVRRRS